MQHVLSTTTSASASDVDRHQAVGLEQAGDALGVVLVHLAPEGAHDVRPGHGPPGYEAATGADVELGSAHRRHRADAAAATRSLRLSRSIGLVVLVAR